MLFGWLRYVAGQLRVDAHVVQWTGHDRQSDIAGLRTSLAGAFEVVALHCSDDADNKPHHDNDTDDAEAAPCSHVSHLQARVGPAAAAGKQPDDGEHSDKPKQRVHNQTQRGGDNDDHDRNNDVHEHAVIVPNTRRH
jgi:hypothetical protein